MNIGSTNYESLLRTGGSRRPRARDTRTHIETDWLEHRVAGRWYRTRKFRFYLRRSRKVILSCMFHLLFPAHGPLKLFLQANHPSPPQYQPQVQLGPDFVLVMRVTKRRILSGAVAQDDCLTTTSYRNGGCDECIWETTQTSEFVRPCPFKSFARSLR